MPFQFEKVNPKFRQLTDLLFFSNRMDLDLSDFKSMLKDNYTLHSEYLWDRFKKATEIFWEQGESFWSHRLYFLLSLNEKTLTKNVEEHLEKRMFHLVKTKSEVNMAYDIEHLQFVELCKIKHDRGEKLTHIRDYLISLPSHSRIEKIIEIIRSFTPIVFKDLHEYTEIIAGQITRSYRNFDLLLALEERSPDDFWLDRRVIAKLAKELIVERAHNDKNRRAFFHVIRDAGVLKLLKHEYNSSYKGKLLELLRSCDYRMLEDRHLQNVKSVLELDPSLADEIIEIYAKKLYSRSTGHKKSNADRLIRLVKTCPQLSPKKILTLLSSNNQISDLKYVLSAFPDLKKLAAFV